jgi:hypothetical protein
MGAKSEKQDRRPDALFLGRQQCPPGKSFALYTIIAVDHESYGSTVGEETLRRLNLKVPVIPPHMKVFK